MSDIRKYVQLIESYERVDEVRVIGSQESEPLKDTDTVLVYHGTSSIELVKQWVTKGLTGDIKANRTYSYEFNNNPKGLFVTPDINTAKQFGTIIIEFHSSASDLESPVWPSGTYTVAGGTSGVFKDDGEREYERQRQRDLHSQSKETFINNSDRPELAAIFMGKGERQALFTGDLNPRFVKAVWLKDNPDKAVSSYSRYKINEFLKVIKNDKFRHHTFNRQYKDNDEHHDDLVINPREYLTGDEFLQRIIDNDTSIEPPTVEEIKSIFKKYPEELRIEVWSDRQFKHYKKELGID